jgi:hypothetical protein
MLSLMLPSPLATQRRQYPENKYSMHSSLATYLATWNNKEHTAG